LASVVIAFASAPEGGRTITLPLQGPLWTLHVHEPPSSPPEQLAFQAAGRTLKPFGTAALAASRARCSATSGSSLAVTVGVVTVPVEEVMFSSFSPHEASASATVASMAAPVARRIASR
jgi:hypothetical protein